MRAQHLIWYNKILRQLKVISLQLTAFGYFVKTQISFIVNLYCNRDGEMFLNDGKRILIIGNTLSLTQYR